MSLRSMAQVSRAAIAAGWNDNLPRLGASISYFTLFSLAPILVIVVAIAGAVFSSDTVRDQIGRQLTALVGPVGAQAVETVLRQAHEPTMTTIASVIGGLVFLLGATSAFLELEAALNDIWHVPPKSRGMGFWGFVFDRILSLGLVVAVGFILMVSLVVSAALAALSGWFQGILPLTPVIWVVLDFAVSIGVLMLLFALVYRVLPNVRLRWREIWVGAFVTALLFSAGKFLIGLYLGRSGVASAYGAAGSVVVLLAWVYYSAQIVLLGAEFTKAYAGRERPAPPPPKKPPIR